MLITSYCELNCINAISVAFHKASLVKKNLIPLVCFCWHVISPILKAAKKAIAYFWYSLQCGGGLVEQ